MPSLSERASDICLLFVSHAQGTLACAVVTQNKSMQVAASNLIRKRRKTFEWLKLRIERADNPCCPTCNFPMYLEAATSDGVREYAASYGCDRGCGFVEMAEPEECELC